MSMSTNTDWLQMELRISRAQTDIIAQSLKLSELSRDVHGATADELEMVSDVISEAVERIDAALTVYKHDTEAKPARHAQQRA